MVGMLVLCGHEIIDLGMILLFYETIHGFIGSRRGEDTIATQTHQYYALHLQIHLQYLHCMKTSHHPLHHRCNT